jgi:hypothetical protein
MMMLPGLELAEQIEEALKLLQIGKQCAFHKGFHCRSSMFFVLKYALKKSIRVFTSHILLRINSHVRNRNIVHKFDLFGVEFGCLQSLDVEASLDSTALNLVERYSRFPTHLLYGANKRISKFRNAYPKQKRPPNFGILSSVCRRSGVSGLLRLCRTHTYARGVVPTIELEGPR